MGKEPVLMWQYLSQYETHSTESAHLEVYRNFFWEKLKTSKSRFLFDCASFLYFYWASRSCNKESTNINPVEG